jgi:hypothetical protein
MSHNPTDVLLHRLTCAVSIEYVDALLTSLESIPDPVFRGKLSACLEKHKQNIEKEMEEPHEPRE